MKFIAIDSFGFSADFDEIEKALDFINVVDNGADKYVFSDYKNDISYVGGLEDVKPYALTAYLNYKKEQCELDDLFEDLEEHTIEFNTRLRNAMHRGNSFFFKRYRYELSKVFE